MELYKEILAKIIEDEKTVSVCLNIKIDTAEIVEGKCYRSLERIQALLNNEQLTDKERIEKIKREPYLFQSFEN